jgi:3-deoxy-D-manno-octulosonic-acid transferase/heptosyltransferase-1
MAIDFHGLFKSAVIMGVARAKRKIGYRSMQELSGLFYNETIPEDIKKHAVERYLDFIRYLGFPTNSPVFFMALRDDERKRAKSLLLECGIDKKDPFVAINTVALWETKLWEDEKFSHLADRIVSELDTKVVFTGGKEKASVDKIISMMSKPAVNLAGRTTLRELACVYESAEAVISTDSGPMHISAAVKTPTVALFGPTDPVRTGPYGEGHQIVRAGLPCSPCFLKSCTTRLCMEEITVDTVFEAVKNVLAKKR